MIKLKDGNPLGGHQYNNVNTHTMDEQYLIGRARKEDTQAFKQLVLRYQCPLFRFLHGFNMNTARVEEIAMKPCDNFLERVMKQIANPGVSGSYFPFSDEILALFSRYRLLRTITISLGIALGIGQLVQLILGIFFVNMLTAM